MTQPTNTYLIEVRETVIYHVEVEATSEEEAIDYVDEMENDEDDTYDRYTVSTEVIKVTKHDQ